MLKEAMSRTRVLWACVIVTWLLLFEALADELVSIASNTPRTYRRPLIEAISLDAAAMLLLVGVIAYAKPSALRIAALITLAPVVFVACDFYHRLPGPQYQGWGEP